MRRGILVLTALLAVSVLSAQTLPSELWKWHAERGEALYRSGKYIEAYEELRKAGALHTEMNEIERRELDYRLAMSAYHGGRGGAEELLEYYLATYPETLREPQVRFALGNILYEQEQYDDALENYKAVDTSKLSDAEKDECNFKTGYSYFVRDEYDTMLPYMSAVTFKSPYYPHAQYCLGYANYRRGDYARAKEYFMSISDIEAYSRVLPFYLINIEFGEGNYHYVAENGGRVLALATGEHAVQLTRMIGESWFQISRWPEAAQYLMEYEKLGGEMDRQTNYMIGYAQYMMDNWDGARRYLSLVPGPDDKLSQNSSYHLADVYLRSGDKQRAMQSFAMASTRGYDDTIAEDALFNYGKLQYELGGGYFNEAINVLSRYLTVYPASPRASQVKEYLAAAYYNSRNYDEAYEAIMQMPDPDNNVRAALQKITYFRALEQYQAGNPEEAWRMLEESLRNRYNAKYTALAGYWQGEILYRQGRFADAAEKYDTYIRLSPKTEPENLMARYNGGYAYFNLQEWEPSRTRFDDFLLERTVKDSYRADTYNRIGDIEFSNRNFWRAIEFYDEAAKLSTPERYYSQYQRAMVLGMVERPQRKVESLNEIVSKGESPYVADAMYQLGREYIAQQRYRDAGNLLQIFIKDYPSAPQFTPALLDLGLVYQNLGDNERSLAYYKQVVECEKYSPYARSAMEAIKGLYVEMNDVDSYFAYAAEVGVETDVNAVMRDSLAFASAQRVYLSGDRDKAADALAHYMAGYPNGAHLSDALYYSGENALAQGDKKQAYGYFTHLAEMYQNNFTERALRRVGELGIDLKDYTNAADAYNQLSYYARTDKVRDAALEGYLTANVLKGSGQDIIDAGADVERRATDRSLWRKAKYEQARAMTSLGRSSEAVSLYAELSVDVSDAVGAESAYRVIEAAYGRGDTKRAEDLIYDMVDKNTPQAYWLAKSFLILGDIYASAGDAFQARATYQSILDGYSNKNDGVIDEAAARIRNLK